MANILITGGSGLIGRVISEQLIQNGHQVSWLSRTEDLNAKIKKYKWDIEKEYIDERALENIDGIIHLAGAGVMDKAWTASYKKELLNSRVKSCDLLIRYLIKKKINLKTFVGGSATGYYGSVASSHLYTEDDMPGSDFLSQICVQWEKSYLPFREKGIRTVIIRTGIVLSKNEGIYGKLKHLFQFGLGAAIGNGKQPLAWIHINDLAAIFEKALFNENMHGIYNAVACEQVNNQVFSKTLAESFKRPLILPNIPTILLKLVLGERVITLSGGINVSNSKLKNTGFNFKFKNLEEALKHLAE